MQRTAATRASPGARRIGEIVIKGVRTARSARCDLSAPPSLALCEGAGHTPICNRDQTTRIWPSNTPIRLKGSSPPPCPDRHPYNASPHRSVRR